VQLPTLQSKGTDKLDSSQQRRGASEEPISAQDRLDDDLLLNDRLGQQLTETLESGLANAGGALAPGAKEAISRAPSTIT